MKRLTAFALMIFVCALPNIGCGGQDQKDAGTTATESDGKAKPAIDNTSAAPADPVREKVDAALKADDKLKSAVVTVEHKDGKILLKGEVADNTAKKQAAEDAAKALKDAGTADKLQNMLTVKAH